MARALSGIVLVASAAVFVPVAAGGAAVRTTRSTEGKKVPLTYTAALTSRLAKEYRDPELAGEVVAWLSPSLLADLESKVPLGALRTSPLLSYRPPKVAAAAIGSLLVFEFGDRVGTDGTVTAGPTNGALAAATEAIARKHPSVPIFAQQQIAELLEADGVPNVTSINPVIASGGGLTYLSTAGVVAQAVADADASGTSLGEVGVIAFSDHESRCILTAEAAGLTAALPKGVKLPGTYDPASGQSWTTNRLSYLEVDLLDRILTL